jgi:hypothetical protein
MKILKNYRYKNLTLAFLSILLSIILSRYNFLNDIIYNSSAVPFVGSFIAGALYVSASTAALGILLLADLSKTLAPIEIAIIAGIGGMVADFVIFRFVKSGLIPEIIPIYNKLGGQRLTNLMHHKLVKWCMPIIGAIIIASPLPDELGICLMGLTNIKNYQFILLCLILDIAGVFLLVSAFTLIN